jgi:hypothetical protein
MRPFEDFGELRGLLDALCEEAITPEQMRRLEELVLGHPEAEAYYLQYMGQYAELARHFVDLPGLEEPSDTAPPAGRGRTAPPPAPRVRRRTWVAFGGGLGLAGLAAGLLLALLLPRPRSQDVVPPAAPAEERLENSVAVLLQAPDAVWGECEVPTRPGSPLPPGRLTLKSGFARIEFYSGATVILEGPADFRLISPREAYCAGGKLRATVPHQAEGFTVRSPKLDLVDRGTEFGLEVGADSKTEVHVFQGKVEVYDAGADRQAAAQNELTTGRGLRLDGPGRLSPIRPDQAAFPTARDLVRREEDDARRRQAAWVAACAAVRQDPSLVVAYFFEGEQPWSRTLTDRAGAGGEGHDGVIVGCSWDTGRWPGKQALEFRQVSDRVRFQVPGELDALTLVAWVRVDSLPNRFNSLMMTEGWEEAAPHWHISSDGKVELGVQGHNRKGWVHYISPPVLTPDRLGQWVQLAVVYDRAGGQVTHYVDGRPVDQQPLKLDIALRIGNADLGNWDIGSRPHTSPIRYFSGCMDEFLLFSRPLGAAEIERLYAEGRPPS